MFGQAMAKIPKNFVDYDSDDPNVGKHQMRFQYWSHLVKLREEYYRISIDRDNKKFMQWVADTYGFQPVMNDTGITDDYKIIDEKKYIFFLLKYG